MVSAKYWNHTVENNSLRWSISGFCWGCNTIFNIQPHAAISSVWLTFHPFIVLLSCFMEKFTFAYTNYSQVQSLLISARTFWLISTAAGSGPSATRLISKVDFRNILNVWISTFFLIQITRITSWECWQSTGYLPQELKCIIPCRLQVLPALKKMLINIPSVSITQKSRCS